MTAASSISNARLFFDELRARTDPYAYLSTIPTTFATAPFFETEWIDFKSNPHTDDKTKEIWSKALSAFANITDGIIVWGIFADKAGPHKIDAAHKLSLIPNALGFESRLRELQRNATNPPVMGVEYQTFTDPIGTGFVVCLIPESRYKPHRAEFGEKYYYYRAGDSFLMAEPGLLRTLFHPQLHPYLEIEATLSFRMENKELADAYSSDPTEAVFNKLVNERSTLHLQFKLTNRGAATAKDTYIVIEASQVLIFDETTDWQRSENPTGRGAFRADRPFHPGEVTQLCPADVYRHFHNKSVADASWHIVPNFPPLDVLFRIYAEGMRPQKVRFSFSPEDLTFDFEGKTLESGMVTKIGVSEDLYI